MISVNEISGIQLQEWQNDNNRLFKLLDVRTQPEMEQAMIVGGIPFEIKDIESDLDKIGKQEELVIYCRSGIRSYQFCEHLLKKGYSKVFNLAGGIMDWHSNGYKMTNLSNNLSNIS